MTMKTEIQTNLEKNLERVGGLVKLYQDSADGQGRRPVGSADLLRSAVVFLHATLEDVLRSCQEWKWPQASEEYFEKVPFAGTKGKTTTTLLQLAKHRTKSVQDLIDEAVAESLERSNFNNLGEIKTALGRIGAAESVLDPYGAFLEPMMRRRHHIVHRADRNEMRGAGHHAARPISRDDVTAWRDAVRGFCTDLLATL